MVINEDNVDFYTTWFNNRETATAFLQACQQKAEENKVPLRLANQLARVMIFSDFCMTHKKGNRSVQVFLWMALIESFEYIYFPDRDSEKVDKLGVILNFFRSFILPEDKVMLLKNLRRSISDDRFFEEYKEMNIDIVARIFYSIRNQFVHGLDFHTSLFSDSNDDVWLETIKMKEFKKDNKEERDFEMSITHEQLRGIIIRGCINMIELEMVK